MIVIMLVVVLDQITKFLAEKFLTSSSSLPVIKGFLHLTLIHNTGIAFGLFKGENLFFICFSLVIIILILAYVGKRALTLPFIEVISLNLILGGAIGNLIDRVRFGYVVDFLDLRIWPVFNIADSCITIGTIMLFLCIFKKKAAI